MDPKEKNTIQIMMSISTRQIIIIELNLFYITKATCCNILPMQKKPMVYFTLKMKARNTKS